MAKKKQAPSHPPPTPQTKTTKKSTSAEVPDFRPSGLLQDLQDLIRSARENTAQTVNSALVLLYWRIGTRIRTEILDDKRAPYGEPIVSTLSTQLTAEFRRGFTKKAL